MSFSQQIKDARSRRANQGERVPSQTTPAPFLLDGKPHPFDYQPGGEIRFLTMADLMHDTQRLAGQLPHVSRIVGISRSGLSVASMLSLLLHRPLSIVRQSSGDVIDGGCGHRLSGHVPLEGPVLLVDDTVMSGRSLHHALPLVQGTFSGAEILSSAVYVNPHARAKPDMFASELEWPHLLEWNLFNSILTPSMAFDFDGILCGDCPADSVENEAAYLHFLDTAEPLYLPRKTPIPLIVTARLEQYREPTRAWLARHGIECERLVMGPWESHAERSQSDVAAWKAIHFRWFLSQSHAIHPVLFVESCPHQAKRIASLSGGLVVCPSAGRCYP